MPKTVRLVQLPIPPLIRFAPTGNVPLAGGSLAAAARRALGATVDVELVSGGAADDLGDARLASLVAADEPDVVGLSLYLWNAERSLHLARAIRERSPRTRIVVGGPEVSADNPFLMNQLGARSAGRNGTSTAPFDVAVTGEAERSFAAVLDALLRGRSTAGLAGVLAPAMTDGASALVPAEEAELAEVPSPYLDGTLRVDPLRSTYVETVRGCRSHCTFCFYPRSSTTLRALDIDKSLAMLRRLRDLGAREVVFLDPTFNHRPGFDTLLAAIARENAGRELTFFAEVRAEGLTEAHADLLAAAGFTRLELGMQSVNPETLTRVRRGGDPARVARAARWLADRGIDLLIDLIVGLPGDDADDVRRGVGFLIEHGLGRFAQVFPLSVLPGTAMRASAAADGLEYDSFPPYRIRRTKTLDAEEMRGLIEEAEDALDRPLDETPRPFLAESARAGRDGSDAPDVLQADVDGPLTDAIAIAAMPAAAHAALWIRGRDLWASRDDVRRVIEARLATDPHGVLDVVLAPGEPPPLDLIDVVRSTLDGAPSTYARWWLSHRGEDAARRVTVIADRTWPADYLAHLGDRAAVFTELSATDAARAAERLGDDLPGARVIGPVDEAAWRTLANNADPDAVAFADRRGERRHVADALGLAEL